MKHVIDEEEVTVIDYLSGDDFYKKDWMNERRQVYGLIAYNKRKFIGLLLILIYHLKQKVKKLSEIIPDKKQITY